MDMSKFKGLNGWSDEELDALKEEVFVYLDRLRSSGVTNMFGASPYVHDEFPLLTKQEARTVLGEWMRTFSERHQNKSI
jgi:hypothetical protein